MQSTFVKTTVGILYQISTQTAMNIPILMTDCGVRQDHQTLAQLAWEQIQTVTGPPTGAVRERATRLALIRTVERELSLRLRQQLRETIYRTFEHTHRSSCQCTATPTSGLCLGEATRPNHPTTAI